jgi:hypothetical protein
MLRSLSSRMVFGLLLATFALPLAAKAQAQEDQSVADAARRARELKKTTVKPLRVVTEDDLPSRPPDSGSQPAAAHPAASTQPAAGQPAGPAGAAPPAPVNTDKKSKAAADAELAALKEAVEKAQKEADSLKRELALDQDTFFSNADSAHDSTGKAKLDELRQLLSDKQQDLSDLQAKLAALKPADSDTTPADNSNNSDQPAAPAPQP